MDGKSIQKSDDKIIKWSAYPIEVINAKSEAICALIEQGVSNTKATNMLGIPHSTFFDWRIAHEHIAERYKRAMEQRIMLKFESIEDDYSVVPQVTDRGNVDNGFVQWQKLRIESKKWELSKLAPHLFGDKLDITSQGDKVTQPTINITYKPPTED